VNGRAVLRPGPARRRTDGVTAAVETAGPRARAGLVVGRTGGEWSPSTTESREGMGQDRCVRCATDLVRVFEFDPDLLDGQDERTAAHLRTRMVARRTWADPGTWQPEGGSAGVQDGVGVLVLDGLLVRTVQVCGHTCAELVGPGDVLQPCEHAPPDGSVACAGQWRVLQTAMFAMLDGPFAARVACRPGIAAALLERSMRRSRSLAHQTAIAGVRLARTRVLLSLWHLAERWGRVTPGGVALALPLTHQLLAQLTCLQRPTVSSALAQLARSGELARLPEAGWLLRGQPPAMPQGADLGPVGPVRRGAPPRP
jgi:CRP/FNR family transcriptional regulator, cyclic AMP receptor protein